MHTRMDGCGLRPDLAAERWQWAQSPSGPSKLQLWDVKTIGMRPTYEANNRISPVDQRASRVPPTYRLLAAKADVKEVEPLGARFGRALPALPGVAPTGHRAPGCARSGLSRWTDSSARRPNSGASARSASGVAMGHGERKDGWPCGCVVRSTARCCVSLLGAVIRRSTAPSSALPRRTRVIPRSAVVPTAAPRSRASGTSSTGPAIARHSLERGDVHAAPRRCVFGTTSGRPSRLD